MNITEPTLPIKTFWNRKNKSILRPVIKLIFTLFNIAIVFQSIFSNKFLSANELMNPENIYGNITKPTIFCEILNKKVSSEKEYNIVAHAVSETGTEIKNVEFIVKAQYGVIQPSSQKVANHYLINYTAPKTTKILTENIFVTGLMTPKQDSNDSTVNNGTKQISQICSFKVYAENAGNLKLSVDKTIYRPDRDKKLHFFLEGSRDDGLPIDVTDVAVKTSSGSIQQLTKTTTGKIEGFFLPEHKIEQRLAPHFVLIGAFLKDSKLPVGSLTTITILGSANIPVRTEPNAKVLLKAGSQQYGPYLVDDTGSLSIPITIYPNQKDILIEVSDSAGNITTSRQDLSIPSYNKTIFFMPETKASRGNNLSSYFAFAAINDNGVIYNLSKDQINLEGQGKVTDWRSVNNILWGKYTAPSLVGKYILEWQVNFDSKRGANFISSFLVSEGRIGGISVEISKSSISIEDPPVEIKASIVDSMSQPTSSVNISGFAKLGIIEPFKVIGQGEYISLYRPPKSIDLNPSGEIISAVKDSIEIIATPLSLEKTVSYLSGKSSARWITNKNTPEILTDETSTKVKNNQATWSITAKDSIGGSISGIKLKVEPLKGSLSCNGIQETDINGEAIFSIKTSSEINYSPSISVCRVSVVDNPQIFHDVIWVHNFDKDNSGKDNYSQTDLNESNSQAFDAQEDKFIAKKDILLRPSKVKEVDFTISPNVIYVGEKRQSNIHLKLKDSSGNFVIDPDLNITASEGVIKNIVAISSGEYRGIYEAPEKISSHRKVKVIVSNAFNQYKASTEIQLYKKDSKASLSLQTGFNTNFGAILSPSFSIRGLFHSSSIKLPIYVGAALSYHFIKEDYLKESINASFFPLHLYMIYRHQTTSWVPYFGVSPVLSLSIFGRTVKDDMDKTVFNEKDSKVLFGLSGVIGVERLLPKGGLSIEISATKLPAVSLFDDLLVFEGNLGWISLQAGYTLHF